MADMLAPILFVLLLLIAAAWDVHSRRIPNVLTVPAFLVALALSSFDGWTGLSQAFQGAGVALLLALPLLAVSGMGGGDAKLLIAVGAFMGVEGFLASVVFTGVAGGSMAFYYSYRYGMLAPVLQSTVGLMQYGLTAGRYGSRPTLDKAGALSIPYGVSIATGTLMALFYRGGL